MLFFKTNRNDESTKYTGQQRALEQRKSVRAPDPREPLPENTEIEGYRFGKVIGTGSFSIVYLCVDTRTNEQVVIKEYFPKRYAFRKPNSHKIRPHTGKHLILFKDGFVQFFKEALAFKKIQHPNVLKTRNIFRANSTTYMVANGVGAQDLRKVLAATGKRLIERLFSTHFYPF